MDGGVAARERSTLPAIPTLPALPTAACMVTPEWTSSMQLLLSRVNAPEHKNVLELLRFGRFGTFGVGHAQRSVSPSPLSLLRHDHLVLAALLKKNKAQHRRSRWWQRLISLLPRLLGRRLVLPHPNLPRRKHRRLARCIV